MKGKRERYRLCSRYQILGGTNNIAHKLGKKGRFEVTFIGIFNKKIKVYMIMRVATSSIIRTTYLIQIASRVIAASLQLILED